MAPLKSLICSIGVLLTAVVSLAFDVDPYLVGSYHGPGSFLGAAVYGDFAFVANGDAGVQVIDFSNPALPQKVGFWNIGYTSTIKVRNNYAYAACGSSGLRILDLANPTNAPVIGSYNTAGFSWDLELNGNYALVADGPNGLEIIDVSNPYNPRRVNGARTFGTAYDVELVGNIAYVAAYDEGLQIFELMDQYAPRLLGKVAIPHAEGVAVLGDYAYVCRGSSLEVVNISQPNNAQWRFDATIYMNCRFISIKDNLAYVTGSGLRVFDLSNPVRPNRLGQYWLGDNLDFSHRIAFSGPYVLVPNSVGGFFSYPTDGLLIVKALRPAQPQRVSSLPALHPAEPAGVAISGNFAYAAEQYDGFSIYDISNSTNLTRISTLTTTGLPAKVTLSGRFAYLSAGDSGMKIVNVINPHDPKVIGELDTDGSVQDIVVIGPLAYLADYTGGLKIVNVSAPANPQLVGQTNRTGFHLTPLAVAVSGQFAYVAADLDGLQVYDISNPANPRFLTNTAAGTSASSVLIAGTSVAAVIFDGISYKVVLFDVANPARPTQLGAVAVRGLGLSLALSGNFIYIAEGAAGSEYTAGIEVIDITDPTCPTRVGGNFSVSPSRICAGPNSIFISEFKSMTLLDLFRPPRLETRATPTGPSLGVSGPRGVPFLVQTSPDFLQWQDWKVITPTEGYAHESDPDSPSLPARYFRAIQK